MVPTTYDNGKGLHIYSNQYSVTEHFTPIPEFTNIQFPGLYVYYDLSPIKVPRYCCMEVRRDLVAVAMILTLPYCSDNTALEQVLKKQVHVPFIEFLTSSCAIVGGVFTVSSIIDALIYHGTKAVKKKVDLGKFR